MREVAIQASTAPLPPDVLELIADGYARIDDLIEARRDQSLGGFVASEFAAIYPVLASLAARMDGGCFVEWGSGFGVVTMMAAKLGFDAGGIEIQPDLVLGAEELARDHEIWAEFATGSFVPPTARGLLDEAEWPEWLEHGGIDGHESLDVDPRDIELVFAYPWPGEARVIESVFEAICEPGALLLTWNGIEDLRLLRKE